MKFSSILHLDLNRVFLEILIFIFEIVTFTQIIIYMRYIILRVNILLSLKI